MDDLNELFAMAHMYAHTCTRQYEKYQGFQNKGYTWNWDDCIAAFNLLKEHFGAIIYYEKMVDWRAKNTCHACGFPLPHHTFGCTKKYRR